MKGNIPFSTVFVGGGERGENEAQVLGFVLLVGDAEEPLPCSRVLGFGEAMLAAKDPTVPMPARLVIVTPGAATDAWLARWAEDCDQVRRTMTICRRSDGSKVTAVVTLAAYGYGTDTSLAVESLTLPWQTRRIVRSGVHPKAFLEAVLGGLASRPGPLLDPTEPA